MYVEITTLKTYVCWYEERKLYSDIVWLQINVFQSKPAKYLWLGSFVA